MRLLVACFGNVLRGDDGFGVVVAERLLAGPVPAEVQILDVGIGGIHLVQELLDPVKALVTVDAMNLGRSPGTVLVVRPDVRDVATTIGAARLDALADMHYATPDRAFTLARGLGILPPTTLMVGCQLPPQERLGEGLSPVMAAGVDAAAAEVRRVVSELGVLWLA